MEEASGLKRLHDSLNDAPIVMKDTYPYVIHPLTDGVPRVDPTLLAEVRDEIIARVDDWSMIDVIVGAEAMALPLISAVALEVGLPYLVVRKRKYDLPGERSLDQHTGYSSGELFINDLKAGERIVLLDDVISTGGTMVPLLKVLEDMEVNVHAVIVVVAKGSGIELVAEKNGLQIDPLIRIQIDSDGSIRAL